MGVLVQIIATILLCFSCMNMILITTWPSSTILLFKSVNTTLHRPMGDMEIAVFGSVPAVSALVTNPLAALVLDRLGRKHTAMLTSMFFVVAWSIIAISNRVEAILTAVLISGLGYPIFIEVIIYLSEISQDSIRGTLIAGANQFCGIGLLVSYLLGAVLGYHAMVYTCLSLAVAGVLMITVLKESPVILMKKGREEDAAKSLAFYRRMSTTSDEVQAEMRNIRFSLSADSKDAQSQVGDQIVGKPDGLSCWEFFKSSPSTRRQLYLVLMLNTAYIWQGLPAVQVYAEPMFAAAVGDVISPNLCSVILGVVVLIAGTVAAYLIDVVGRRPLQIYSSIVTGTCCLVLGAQILTEWFPKWMVPLLIYIFATSHTVGSGAVPFVMTAEVFLPEVKSILIVLTAEWAYICQFVALFCFNVLMQSVGLAPVFFFFCFVCFTTAVYFFYFLPETKGLPVYAIQQLFKKKDE